jgi:hypothetical protein
MQLYSKANELYDLSSFIEDGWKLVEYGLQIRLQKPGVGTSLCGYVEITPENEDLLVTMGLRAISGVVGDVFSAVNPHYEEVWGLVYGHYDAILEKGLTNSPDIRALRAFHKE